MIDRLSVDKAVKNFHDALTNRNTDAKDLPIIRCRSRLELGNFPITFSSDEWLDFIELSLADWLLKKKFLLNLILLQCHYYSHFSPIICMQCYFRTQFSAIIGGANKFHSYLHHYCLPPTIACMLHNTCLMCMCGVCFVG